MKQRYRDAGKSCQEANRLAWQAVHERFPAEDPPAIKTLDAALFRGGLLTHPIPLRTGRKSRRLRLDSVDWDTDRIRVDSPKTEHHAAKAFRIIPLFPELRPYLEERWHQAEPGDTRFIRRYGPGQTVSSQFARIVRRANLTPWEKLWHNMRASRQTEFEKVFPSHVVCGWPGNSQQVARKHYLQITDDHFAKAASSQCAKIVASTASQDSPNEKCHASETARTSYVSQGVARRGVFLRPYLKNHFVHLKWDQIHPRWTFSGQF